jgi:hypothetical protein
MCFRRTEASTAARGAERSCWGFVVEPAPQALASALAIHAIDVKLSMRVGARSRDNFLNVRLVPSIIPEGPVLFVGVALCRVEQHAVAAIPRADWTGVHVVLRVVVELLGVRVESPVLSGAAYTKCGSLRTHSDVWVLRALRTVFSVQL